MKSTRKLRASRWAAAFSRPKGKPKELHTVRFRFSNLHLCSFPSTNMNCRTHVSASCAADAPCSDVPTHNLIIVAAQSNRIQLLRNSCESAATASPAVRHKRDSRCAIGDFEDIQRSSTAPLHHRSTLRQESNVAAHTPSWDAASLRVISPRSYAASTLAKFAGICLRGRPNCTPRALAAAMPSACR